MHAVSVGEVNAARKLLAHLVAPPLEAEIVVCSTTNTGCARAEALFGGTHYLARYPLDFSFAVNRFLRAVQPDVIVLIELEVWPNFVKAAARRCIPVCVVNGRLTERSAAGHEVGYRRDCRCRRGGGRPGRGDGHRLQPPSGRRRIDGAG
ncbi:MAG: glycosyltransferase N-terminal domain-containing protein [Planctomycetota bacterium]